LREGASHRSPNEQWNPFRIDLLLTDIVMPGLNGRELADQLHHRQTGLRVLFMTGYSRNAIVHQGRLDAGVSLRQKPVTQGLLAAKIRKFSTSRRANEPVRRASRPQSKSACRKRQADWRSRPHFDAVLVSMLTT
jgi:FixJ family two-component response regulator